MKSNRRRPSAGCRPRIEILEDRCVPADFSGSISGTAFVDRNHNGRFDHRETALSGAQVKLVGTTNQLVGTTTQHVAVHVIVTADADGKFKFDNVMPGHYKVVGKPTANRPAGPALRVTLHDGQNITRNVAFGTIRAGSVNLRQLLNNAPPGSVTPPPPGSGVALAADRADNKPIATKDPTDPTKDKLIPEQQLSKNQTTAKFLDMAAYFDDVDLANSKVIFHTTAGNINVELFDRAAPQTVANFLNYVTSNQYDNSVFHRLMTGFVLQAGGFTYNEDLRTITEIPDGPAVNNEFDGVNRSNLVGTIAMAKLPAFQDTNNNGTQDPGEPSIPGGGPDSATNQFFFNLANNSSNLDHQNGGFTVFGKIVGTADQTVLNALAAFTPTNKSSFNGAFDNFPLKNYSGTNFPTDVTPSNLAMITDVEVVSRPEKLTYKIVNNTNPGLFDVDDDTKDGVLDFVNNQLKIVPAKGQIGTAMLTIQATDKFGATVDRLVKVTVNDDPPTASLTLDAATVSTDTQTLKASVTASDPNSDPVSVEYVWKINGQEVQRVTKDGTSTDDTLNLRTIVPGGVKPNDVILVTATPKDGTVSGPDATGTRTVGDRLPSLDNGSPVFTNGEIGVDAPSPTTLTVTASGTDPDGSTVTFDYEWSYNGQVVKNTPGGTGSDSLDIATEVPVGITRHTGDVVSVKVTPKADGAAGASSSVSFTVDQTPTVDGDGIADHLFSDPGINSYDVSGDFSDPDGDTLNFTATLDNGDPLPAWLHMASDGTLSGDPTPQNAGVYQITVKATDPVGRFVNANTTFTLTVQNDAPEIDTLTADPAHDFGTSVDPATDVLTAKVTAHDDNGDPITVNYVWTVVRASGTPVQLQTAGPVGTSTSNTLTLADVSGSAPGGSFQSGDQIIVTVTPTDGVATGSAFSNSWTIA